MTNEEVRADRMESTSKLPEAQRSALRAEFDRLLNFVEEDDRYSMSAWVAENPDGDSFRDGMDVTWYRLKNGVPLEKAVEQCILWRRFLSEQKKTGANKYTLYLFGDTPKAYLIIQDEKPLDALGEGRAALTLSLDPKDYPFADMIVGGDYNVEFDNRGYIVEFLPVTKES